LTVNLRNFLQFLFITSILWLSWFSGVHAQDTTGNGSYLRLRVIQPTSGDQGKYTSGGKEAGLDTVGSGWMLSYGFLGIGASSLTTKIDAGDTQHKLISEWNELSIVMAAQTSSLTLGVGNLKEGKGTMSYKGNEYTSESATGTSWFGAVGIEYTLPFKLIFVPFDFVEVILGYRENLLTYENYQSGTTSLTSPVKVKTVQYLLGGGVVF